MQQIYKAEDMRRIDAHAVNETGIPSMVLMERAAYSAYMGMLSYDVIKENGNGKNVVILCGCGNNGGDGIAIGRMHEKSSDNVSILIIGSPEKGSLDFKNQLEIAKKSCVSITYINGSLKSNSSALKLIKGADVIVDSIFGTGLTRNVEGGYASVIEAANSNKKAVKVAVDIPSGLNSDTGIVMGCSFKADYTFTFAAGKAGLYLADAADYAGNVIINDIGILETSYAQAPVNNNLFLIDDYEAELLPERKKSSNKGSYGRALIIAGSDKIYGAAHLSALSCYKSGAGLVKVLTTEKCAKMLAGNVPEALISEYDRENAEEAILKEVAWCSAICIGPGIGTDDCAKELVRACLLAAAEQGKKLIIDADALNVISENPAIYKAFKKCAADLYKTFGMAGVVITPHLMEMSRLIKKPVSEIRESLIDTCQGFAKNNKVICILKDAHSVVSNGKKVYINTYGHPSMSKGGSGDVLSGLVCSFLTQGLNAEEAAILSELVHGLSGEVAAGAIGRRSATPSDLIKEIPEVLEFLEDNEQ